MQHNATHFFGLARFLWLASLLHVPAPFITPDVTLPNRLLPLPDATSRNKMSS